MPKISLNDILMNAKQEAHRMRHYYLGAEHLMISLLALKGSLAGTLVQEHGLNPEYVIDAIRRKIGKGSRHHMWAGIPNTPRTTRLLSMAHDIALENGRSEIDERDLFIALFREGDNLPLRVMNALGMSDNEKIIELALKHTLTTDSRTPHILIEYSNTFNTKDPLKREHLLILRRMFETYSKIRVERRLHGGYSNATVLVVTPIQMDNREDAAVVVKLGPVDSILDEARRYESFVKSTLPPMTARIEDRPTAPETSELAGVKYTLVSGNNRIPHDLRAILKEWDVLRVGHWLRNELFPTFGHIWWQQSRSYRFQVWREYDWLLPPLLTLEMVHDEPVDDVQTLSMPIRRTKINKLEFGNLVAVKNFIVQKVYPEKNQIQLAAGHGSDSASAYKIAVRGINLNTDTYYRGEVIEMLVGRVWQTRNEQLLNTLRSLEPNFNPSDTYIRVNLGGLEKILNPMIGYENLMDNYVNGSLSTIHGDLHPGNVMVGPNDSAFLIDFAHTRDGHTIFDWANLEVSLLGDVVMASAGETWEAARNVLGQLITLNSNTNASTASSNGRVATSNLSQSMNIIRQVRAVAGECLETRGKWSEYFIALAFCALRAATWETMSLGGRRLMVLISGLAMYELDTRFRPISETETPSPDETDMNIV